MLSNIQVHLITCTELSYTHVYILLDVLNNIVQLSALNEVLEYPHAGIDSADELNCLMLSMDHYSLCTWISFMKPIVN